MLSQGDDGFNGADDKFKKTGAEENTFNAERVEESVARERSQRARNIAGNVTETENDPKEEE